MNKLPLFQPKHPTLQENSCRYNHFEIAAPTCSASAFSLTLKCIVCKEVISLRKYHRNECSVCTPRQCFLMQPGTLGFPDGEAVQKENRVISKWENLLEKLSFCKIYIVGKTPEKHRQMHDKIGVKSKPIWTKGNKTAG